MKRLPTTGTSALLELLSPYIPDDLINAFWKPRVRRGRPALFSSAQLLRVLLLSLLTPVHSFNLLIQLLPEQRTWRSFACLRNRRHLPDVRMLHDFRSRLELTHLRQINEFLLQPLLEGMSHFAKSVAVIDSTDLPAATSAYKKNQRVSPVLGELIQGLAVAKKDRAAILSATKSTRSASGFASAIRVFCWCH